MNMAGNNVTEPYLGTLVDNPRISGENPTRSRYNPKHICDEFGQCDSNNYSNNYKCSISAVYFSPAMNCPSCAHFFLIGRGFSVSFFGWERLNSCEGLTVGRVND